MDEGRYYLCDPVELPLVVLCVGEAVIGTSVFIHIVEFFHLIQFGMLADLCLDGGRGTDKQKIWRSAVSLVL